jgi:hypothetical protein
MRIRTNYTHAGKSRTREDGVYVDATKDLATNEVELTFTNVFGRLTSLQMSEEEATALSRKISEAVAGRFTFTVRAFE